MGYTRMDPSAWDAHARSTSTKSTTEIFTSKGLREEFDPTKFKIRESRDSTANPTSNAIIIACDVTGSMGIIAENLIRQGIGTVFQEILNRASAHDVTMVTDPHLLVMGIGDVRSDRAPVQATQFESDMQIVEQLANIWLEGNGGGNQTESYDAAWYFASERTAIDCFDKRAKKGYLFTVGDEMSPAGITVDQMKHFFGDTIQADLSAAQMLAMAEERWNVFHVVVEEGTYARSHKESVLASWKEILGQRVIPLSDYKQLAEVIVSAIAVNEGSSVDTVVKSWSGATAIAVARAVSGITPVGTSSGVVRL